MSHKIFFAIPAMNEPEIYKTLDCIKNQDCENVIEVFVCINQPKSYYNDVSKRQVITNNEKTRELLKKNPWKLNLHIIDRFSKGHALDSGHQGVGNARKQCIEEILQHAIDTDILVNMDADTTFDKNFASSVADVFENDNEVDAVNIPYYHLLGENEYINKAILSYEIYLRCFLINMLRIKSPYAFTALGPAISCRIGSYKKVGGFDTQQAGEDFYFLQKIVKSGKLRTYVKCKIYPSSRISDRVPFGTGPAVKDFKENKTERYPIFPMRSFDRIAISYAKIPQLYKTDCHTPLSDFINEAYGKPEIWNKLRNNYKTLNAFTKAFHQQADGLKIFRFLRQSIAEARTNNEENLKELLSYIGYDLKNKKFTISEANAEALNNIRNFLEKKEIEFRENFQNL